MEGMATEYGNGWFTNIGQDSEDERHSESISSGGRSDSVGIGILGSDEGTDDFFTGSDNEVDDGCNGSGEEIIVLNDMADIMKIDRDMFSSQDVGKYEFANLDVAYKFYCWFARICGFSVRKGSIIRSRDGDIVQQTFLCSCHGFREDRGLAMENRKREPKNVTRCGCRARCRVHVDFLTKRWYVTILDVEHNHELLVGTLCGFLPAYRKLTQVDIDEVENNIMAGIRPYQVFGAMANASGSFTNVRFIKKDLYNQVSRQRKQIYSDSCEALKYLRDLRHKDPLMFVTHTIDKNKKLERLFWCDGESRMNYKIFGDVVAFDATYRKKKYNCPFVVFSGVNHHNQTIVFGTGIVTRETEETYVWLLQQFLVAMNGKHPLSVITDGDLAMKNAIKKIFPDSHHRLCAWHLLRNASTNIGIPDFMSHLKKCMLVDMEVSNFEKLWSEMVNKFGLQQNSWMKELYEKRKMWATAHIRGTFFAGIRTTYHCEALHSHIGRFLHSRINMTDFVQQFHRCLTYFRFREVEADFHSNHGVPVMQTTFHGIERSASKQYTKEIFLLFRGVLKKALLLRVSDSQEMSTGYIFKVMKYCGKGSEWYVTYCEDPMEMRCSCLRMESLGLPCNHVVNVLLYLDYDVLPKCFVLPRWSKFAKDEIRELYANGQLYWDSQPAARYSGIVGLSKVVVELVYDDIEDYNEVVELLGGEICRLKAKNKQGCLETGGHLETDTDYEDIMDPEIVRTKGCGAFPDGTPAPKKGSRSCGICREVGHNKRGCPRNSRNDGNSQTQSPLMTRVGTHGNPGIYEHHHQYEMGRRQ